MQKKLTDDALDELVLRVQVVHQLLLTVEILDVLWGGGLQPARRKRVTILFFFVEKTVFGRLV